MSESYFDSDLLDEKEIGRFLDVYLYKRLPKHFKAIHSLQRNHCDKNNQFKGVDLTVQYKNGNAVNIDEKAANKYFDKNLPTFVLEVSFINNSNVTKDGWLFGNQYSKTDTYLFCWGKTHKSNSQIYFNNIKEIEAFSINKQNLKSFLNKYYKLNNTSYIQKSVEALEALTNNKFGDKVYLKGNKGPYWKVSSQLNERPLNIVCPKYILEEVTDYKFIIKEDCLDIYTKALNNKWVKCI
ncbi:Uncharacterised protein [Staphylococcus piscifermentans]|uniref:Uncharacterized protein n=1 Tax=Staphylococcus piscifermentans TaxID=70258 RepID=A0A239TH70_9STAP|nr:hypothetical protein [Staphylococcus piscifermentans]RTX83651.1 hypothetical protein CD139_08355 [Staphylococcus piscifermentans]GEP85348.1 hypothetical protein SPI02_19330 [Staphylococcus piscifermentans]SNU96995.1 Uncharacterised protein [Staphylococcus piscifermentans]